jgi:hypothetical protein
MTENIDGSEFLDEITLAYERVAADLETHSRLQQTKLAENYRFYDNLYKPHPELEEAIERYESSFSGRKSTSKQGELLEEVAYLVFRGLGVDKEIRSFRSFDSQLDLIVSGIEVGGWNLMNRLLGLPKESSMKIILEAKNTNKQIDSQIFSRLCFLLQHRHGFQCSLGIFFARKGATGFPKRGKAQNALSAARATQILFHVATGKYIVVFDQEDILNLKSPGSLIRLLQLKIRDVEDAVGTREYISGEKIEIETHLPPHLRKYP